MTDLCKIDRCQRICNTNQHTSKGNYLSLKFQAQYNKILRRLTNCISQFHTCCCSQHMFHHGLLCNFEYTFHSHTCCSSCSMHPKTVYMASDIAQLDSRDCCILNIETNQAMDCKFPQNSQKMYRMWLLNPDSDSYKHSLMMNKYNLTKQNKREIQVILQPIYF